jgi:flagellar hook assembly protein FlgD
MKKWISAIVVLLVTATAVLASPANPALAGSPGGTHENQLQEYLNKYKYPYAEVPPDERVPLAQYAIKKLNEQIAHFQPGKGTTMTYLTSTLTHMQELLTSPAQETIAPEGVIAQVSAAGAAAVAINMIYYGWNYSSTDQRIINAVPEFLVNNSPAGPWKGNADVGKFMSAGIKYFEYIDGGYEGTQSRSIPNDLQSNLNYITAADQAGAYGIFLDEVSDGIWTPANYTYLQQISEYAHSLGLKVVFNTGMSTWSDNLMNDCDYVNSSEDWQDTSLTASQSKWASRTWLLTESVSSASKAISLTEGAWNKGIRAHYACASYMSLPDWLEDYVSGIRGYATPTGDFSLSASPSTLSFTSSGSSTFTVSITPTGGFADPITLTSSSTPSGLTVTPGSASISSPYSAITFTVSSNTPGGYVVNISGSNGLLTHTASVSVTVNAPSTQALSVSVSTDSSSYKAGQTVTSTVNVRSSGSRVANAAVSISIKNESGTVVYSDTGTTSSRGTVSFNWNTGGASSGTYTVTASASKSGYTSGSDSTSFTISATPTGDFSISASPSMLSFTSGGSSTFTISITPTGEFADPITLTSSSTPSGLTVTPGSVSISSPYSATNFTVSSNTSGEYVVNITGTSGSLMHTASVSVTVNAPTTQALSVSVSTDSSRYRAGRTVTSTVNVRSSGSRVANAVVSISIENQSGTVVYSDTGTTNSRGTVSFNWNTRGASSGTYTVTALASKSGYISGSDSSSFTIR